MIANVWALNSVLVICHSFPILLHFQPFPQLKFLTKFCLIGYVRTFLHPWTQGSIPTDSGSEENNQDDHRLAFAAP